MPGLRTPAVFNEGVRIARRVSSLGASAQTISTGTFVTGLVELAIVIAGLFLAFSGRVLGGVLVAQSSGAACSRSLPPSGEG